MLKVYILVCYFSLIIFSTVELTSFKIDALICLDVRICISINDDSYELIFS